MAALSTFALVGVAVAAVASASTALISGIQQSNVAKYNARLAEQNAQIARDQGIADEQAFRRKAARMRAAQVAAYGASGVTLEGSPLDVLGDTDIEIEKQAMDIRYNSEMAGRRFDISANESRYKARSALTGGYIGAGTALLSGAGKLIGNWPSGSTSAGSAISPADTGNYMPVGLV